MHILAKETFYKRFSFIQKTFQKHKSLKTKTLPQALRTQALTALTSRFGYKLLPALTAVTSCWQLHLNFITTSTSYLIPSLRVNSLLQLLPVLQVVTSRWQLNLNFIAISTLLRYFIPSLRVNSLSPALTAVTAVASFASFDSCYKPLAAKPQFHFNVNIAYIFDSINKGQFIKSSTRSSVSEFVTDMGRL